MTHAFCDTAVQQACLALDTMARILACESLHVPQALMVVPSAGRRGKADAAGSSQGTL